MSSFVSFLLLSPFYLFFLIFFFFNDTATTEIYTLSLHDALPISDHATWLRLPDQGRQARHRRPVRRSEEHTSELQSRGHLVCRLLLEKKKKKIKESKHNIVRKEIILNEYTSLYISDDVN